MTVFLLRPRTRAARSESGTEAPGRRPLLVPIALRELRGGFTGFRVFLAAIALGVAAITGIGSLSLSIVDGLAGEGRVILGGDISADLVQRELDAEERMLLSRLGRISEVAIVRAMARAGNGEAALVELKAVDDGYPLVGRVGLDPALPLAEALDRRGGRFGIVADAALFAKLDLAPGALVEIGETTFELRARLAAEPDRLAAGIGIGSRVLVSREGLEVAGIVEPGALVRWQYRVALEQNGIPARDSVVDRAAELLREAAPRAGWEIRTRNTISPQLSRNLERLTTFLELVGVTSLIIGGVGVANAIASFVERKRATIAVLKTLGASGNTVFALVLAQVMLVAAIAVAIGAGAGVTLPYLVASIFGPDLPFPIAAALHPSAIGTGILYGLLTGLTFSIWPLARAHDMPVQALFRDEIAPSRARPRKRYVFLLAASCAMLLAATLAFSADRFLTTIYVGATLVTFALLRLLGSAIMATARRLPHPRNVSLRLAIVNIYRPGTLTPSIAVSLGLGLTLVVALSLIDADLRKELHEGIPGKRPSLYFIDVHKDVAGPFTAFLTARAPEGRIEHVPMLRGRIVELNGLRADAAVPKENAAWVLRGDRGMTFSDSVPAGSALVTGSWWPRGYDGPPLVSLDEEIADGLGLAPCDDIAVNVLGREIRARIANLRKVNWRSLGINFVLVFSPNTFAGAPFNEVATLTFPGELGTSRELDLLRETAKAFPSVTTIRVKDALDTVANAMDQVSTAVECASTVAILAAILVLGGALASGQQARTHDAVVLKTLGATRRAIAATFLYEFGLVGLMTAIFGLAVGSVAAFAVVEHVMKFDFTFVIVPALGAAAVALCLTMILGLAATWHILGQRPARYLREL
jgi:putative ABC transport system permease protein